MKYRIEVEWDDYFEGVNHVGIADAVLNELSEGYFSSLDHLIKGYGNEMANRISYLLLDVERHIKAVLSFLNRLEEGAEMVRNTETEKQTVCSKDA